MHARRYLGGDTCSTHEDVGRALLATEGKVTIHEDGKFTITLAVTISVVDSVSEGRSVTEKELKELPKKSEGSTEWQGWGWREDNFSSLITPSYVGRKYMIYPATLIEFVESNIYLRRANKTIIGACESTRRWTYVVG